LGLFRLQVFLRNKCRSDAEPWAGPSSCLRAAIGAYWLRGHQGSEEQPATLGGLQPGARGGASGDPSPRRAHLLRRGRLAATAGEVLGGALCHAETRGARRIKWHDLRHSYASIFASGGMPLFLIRGLLGHSSIAMTERYAHLAASQTAAFMPLLSTAAPPKPPPPPSGHQAGPSILASRTLTNRSAKFCDPIGNRTPPARSIPHSPLIQA
jgi:Phage integrase family